MERRTYKVVSREDAARLGAKTFSVSEHNHYALVAVRGDVLDNVVSWGLKSEGLQAIATRRNDELAQVARMMNRAIKATEETTVEVEQ